MSSIYKIISEWNKRKDFEQWGKWRRWRIHIKFNKILTK
jgi:hypothetical protein